MTDDGKYIYNHKENIVLPESLRKYDAKAGNKHECSISSTNNGGNVACSGGELSLSKLLSSSRTANGRSCNLKSGFM